jgi:glutamate formiminotransferase / 5-formyltetrahydrofolate cyclo-ligase
VAQFSLVEMTSPILLSVPNVSEGRDSGAISAMAAALTASGRSAAGAAGVRLLDSHSDGDHHRSVFTLAGRSGELADGLLAMGRVAVERIDVMGRGGSAGDLVVRGQHPYVGALDVAPIVYLDPQARGAACAEALVVADRIGGELGIPVYLYGELTGSAGRPARTRAELRRGGVERLAARMRAPAGSELAVAPDFGPLRLHPTAGATLVAAREPLVAFNLELAPPATVEDARRIAALVRDGGEQGIPGVRAIGIGLSGGVAQVSMNVERPLEISLGMVTEAVGRHARVAGGELVGLAPRAALAGFPGDVPLPGFDPARHLIENALGLW